MTPAITLLKKLQVDFSIHEYDHDPSNVNFGQEAVEKLGLTDVEVFKTLLATDGQNYFVAVLPVAYQLSLSKFAKAMGVKKLRMADMASAERVTGYLVGGISPIGQKKKLPTVISHTAQTLDKMYVSGGRRGLDVGLVPDELAKVLSARFCDIIDN
ncbi:Cys-tRNA(Pro) deacylase [Moraxella oblonga]|uniref:Cys-tRNA(Pro) deacylase n=1 Tax=Moraxella oblonga TaxID=200413 RepID=UPI00082D43E2|nr:Cys-tRNA(Pro) deacylase [Moraxella oblonga]